VICNFYTMTQKRLNPESPNPVHVLTLDWRHPDAVVIFGSERSKVKVI